MVTVLMPKSNIPASCNTHTTTIHSIIFPTRGLISFPFPCWQDWTCYWRTHWFSSWTDWLVSMTHSHSHTHYMNPWDAAVLNLDHYPPPAGGSDKQSKFKVQAELKLCHIESLQCSSVNQNIPVPPTTKLLFYLHFCTWWINTIWKCRQSQASTFILPPVFVLN